MTYGPYSLRLLATIFSTGKPKGQSYRLQGEHIPLLHIWLDGSVAVLFEHYVVHRKDPQLDIGIHAVKGTFNRMIACMHPFMTEPGEGIFSRGGAGQLIFNLFTGSGRVGIQSMYAHLSTNR